MNSSDSAVGREHACRGGRGSEWGEGGRFERSIVCKSFGHLLVVSIFFGHLSVVSKIAIDDKQIYI